MLAQEGALGELVHQHLRAKGKLGALRLNKLKLPMKKSANSSPICSNSTNGTNERSPKSVKRRRSGKGGNRKKARKKK